MLIREWQPLMPMVWLKIGCSVLLVAALLGMYMRARPPVSHVEIVLTEHGFSPQRITISKGTVVTFRTTASNPFWPASDSHPNHGIYPAFDPKQPIGATTTWQFVFDTAGVWGYHNHLDPRSTGTIFVLGEAGESTKNCLKTRTGKILPQCWAGELQATIESKGLEEAFDSVRAWYDGDPEFRHNCHDVMHIVGAVAHEEFAKRHTTFDRPEAAFCGFGFYHGFIEATLSSSGNDFSEARAYCDVLAREHGIPGTAAACYHGIGHAMFDNLPAGDWGSPEKMANVGVRICERILDDAERRWLCATGVYNSLANAMSAHQYGLSFDVTKPIPVCATQKSEYQASCYMEVGNGLIREGQWNDSQEWRYVMSLEEPVRAYVIDAYVHSEVKHSATSDNVAFISGMCNKLSGHDAEACVDGAISGYFGSAKPGEEHKKGPEFCGAIHDSKLAHYCSVRF